MAHQITNAAALAWAKRRFGTRFAEAAAKSPTFKADLRSILNRRVRVYIVPGRVVAYCSGKAIYIGTHGGFLYQLLSLAHEKFHAVNQPFADPDSRKISEKEFLTHWLQVEADAEAHALQVLGELLEAGQKEGLRTPQKRVRWYRAWKRHGRSRLVEILSRAKISTTGETYRQSLSRRWRQENGLPYRRPRKQKGQQFGV
jgi:hypothetical protein